MLQSICKPYCSSVHVWQVHLVDDNLNFAFRAGRVTVMDGRPVPVPRQTICWHKSWLKRVGAVKSKWREYVNMSFNLTTLIRLFFGCSPPNPFWDWTWRGQNRGNTQIKKINIWFISPGHEMRVDFCWPGVSYGTTAPEPNAIHNRKSGSVVSALGHGWTPRNFSRWQLASQVSMQQGYQNFSRILSTNFFGRPFYPKNLSKRWTLP